MKKTLTLIIGLLVVFTLQNVKAQLTGGSDISEISYSSPREYEIGGITISGTPLEPGFICRYQSIGQQNCRG
jgi:hypothetical protein